MTATELSCGSCGTVLNEKAKFCSECGAAASADAPPAEYKQVTILFADVVRSMDIAAAVGAERLREIMAALVNRAAAVVKRYGGTVDKFTGDGIMAVFGAPVALEDHAVRACLAALGVQEEGKRLAVDIENCDGVDFRIRVGLNSGQVIAGEIGSGPFGYTAVGEQVGLAQRMESIAPPGEVMLSASTAQLVEGAAVLAEPAMVRIKGARDAVPARRLLGMAAQPRRATALESRLVGREQEFATLAAILDQSSGGHGSVVAVAGPPGIGKTRLAAEAVELATNRGIEVFSTFCESHATDVPFRVVARLLRDVLQVRGLDEQTARARLRERFPDADPEDLLLLDDLLGIADPTVELAKIDPDARRRRLIALINTAQLARTRPAMFIVEDLHWIDDVSESMLADFVAVISQTPSLVLFTYRPEYRGALRRAPGAQSVALAPLSDSETAALVADLLGPDSSVEALGQAIADRAAGNPFFAEEIVRELAQRGVLRGNRGTYTSMSDVAEVSVPPTLQATIAARIDRLDPKAKRTLSAAAVIGSRFSQGLLETLGIDPALDDLVAAEVIDQVGFTAGPEYVFHHPLIRAVAYEAQLKSDRAELHLRVAAAIESRDPLAAEQQAALIAEHLEAADELPAAYGWHMRAATWARIRDIAAARRSWERAVKIADALHAEYPNRAGMRIAPRTMLSATAWRVHQHVAGEYFEDLRELCDAAGDKASLAMAMTGQGHDYFYQGRVSEACQLASETWTLLESVADANLTVGLSPSLIRPKTATLEWPEVLQWSQRVIDLADGDPSKGNFILGCPLAVAHATRGIARYELGLPGWRDDQRHGLAMARRADPFSQVGVTAYVYFPGILNGVLKLDDSAMREIEDAVRVAERSGDDVALAFAWITLGAALVHRRTEAERDRGQSLLVDVAEVYKRRGQNLGQIPVINTWVAREMARRGDRDGAIPLMRAAVDDLLRDGRPQANGAAAIGVLVETLLDRATDADLAEAEATTDRLEAAPADEGRVVRGIWLLRLRTLLARARGDAAAYANLRDHYREMARTLGFEGHMAWAEAMS
jgi:class 3 adenylate cyclase/tetratricopeptide (TPR) repeat protein